MAGDKKKVPLTEPAKPQRILVCPDKFKGTLTAKEATAVIAKTLQQYLPDTTILRQPLADGGEGTLDLIATTVPTAKYHRLRVTGPLRKPVLAKYLLASDGRAWIETSEACGLRHVPVPRRDPSLTTTIGVGQLIDDAVARGANHVTLFLGGSATNDGGAGMAGALGYRFFSDRPEDFIPTGESLRWVKRIDQAEVLPALRNVRFTAVCDVDNPLLGPLGATYTYAPQKGATEAQLSYLERNMAHFAGCLEQVTDRKRFNLPGAGAAGGLAAGAIAFLNAELRAGIDVVFAAVDFKALLGDVDLVITGEGCLDEQTLHGKLVSGVGRWAKQRGVPRVVALCGRNELTANQLESIGVDEAFALLDFPAISPNDAMYRPAESLAALISFLFEDKR